MTDERAGAPPSEAQSGPHGGDAVRAGTRWMTGSHVAIQGLRAAVQIFLARLLTPDAFGLIAMALVVMQFLDMFRDLGTRSAIVQKPEISQRFTSSMFVVNTTLGLVLTLGLIVAAPLVAGLFNDPTLTPLLQVLSFATLATAPGLVQQGLLHRELRFRSLTGVRLTNVVVYSVVAIALAVAGFGVWSLVAGVVAGAVAATACAWILSPWRPHWEFDWADVREVAGFSLNYSGSQLVGFLVSIADRAILGRALGATMLGYWHLIDRLVMYPLQAISQGVQQVMFPALSRIGDRSLMGAAFLRAVSVVALVILPAMVGLSLVAESFVMVALGPQWAPAVLILAILAPVSAIDAIGYTATAIFKSTGRTDWLLRWSLVSGVVVIGALIAGLPWGLTGVAIAYAIAAAVLFYPSCAIPLRLVNLRFSALARTLVPYAGATIAMGGVVLVVQAGLATVGAGAWAELSVSVLAGTLSYGGILLIWRPPALWDLLSIIGHRQGKRPAVADDPDQVARLGERG